MLHRPTLDVLLVAFFGSIASTQGVVPARGAEYTPRKVVSPCDILHSHANGPRRGAPSCQTWDTTACLQPTLLPTSGRQSCTVGICCGPYWNCLVPVLAAGSPCCRHSIKNHTIVGFSIQKHVLRNCLCSCCFLQVGPRTAKASLVSISHSKCSMAVP